MSESSFKTEHVYHTSMSPAPRLTEKTGSRLFHRQFTHTKLFFIAYFRFVFRVKTDKQNKTTSGQKHYVNTRRQQINCSLWLKLQNNSNCTPEGNIYLMGIKTICFGNWNTAEFRLHPRVQAIQWLSSSQFKHLL